MYMAHPVSYISNAVYSSTMSLSVSAHYSWCKGLVYQYNTNTIDVHDHANPVSDSQNIACVLGPFSVSCSE